MVLWTINNQGFPHTLAEETPLLEPLFHFSNVRSLPSDCGERVRSLAYNKDTLVSHYLWQLKSQRNICEHCISGTSLSFHVSSRDLFRQCIYSRATLVPLLHPQQLLLLLLNSLLNEASSSLDIALCLHDLDQLAPLCALQINLRKCCVYHELSPGN